VGIPAHTAVADSIARRSITLLRNERAAVPLRPMGTSPVLAVTYKRATDQLAGRFFDARMRSAFPSLLSQEVVRETPASAYQDLLVRARNASFVIVSIYVSAVSATGSVAVSEPAAAFIEELALEGIPHVVVSFGSPYLLREFPHAQAYLLAWGGGEASQRAAATALLGDASITGKTPTRIPPFYAIGDGIQLEAGSTQQPLAPSVRVSAAPPTAGARTTTGPDRFLWGYPTTASFLEADAATVGMSADQLARVDSVILVAVTEAGIPGATLAVGRHGKLVRLRGYGWLDTDHARLASPATLYDMASLTKVMGTTTAVMLLEQEGRLSIDDLVIKHLPGWDRGDPRKSTVTIRQLLMHESGLVAGRPWYLTRQGREGYREALYDEPLVADPGTTMVYSDLGAITLGLIVEAVSGQPLDELLETRVFDQLHMDDTGFLPDPTLLPRIAPTEVDTLWRHEHVHGTVHDENAEAMGGVAGHAGIFSTAFDMAIFADLIARRGVAPPCQPQIRSGGACAAPRADSLRLIRPEIVQEYTHRQKASSSRGLGWDTPEGRSSAGDYLSAASFGHTGFTGTSIWIDPELDLYIVLLTNRVNPTRANQAHIDLRRAVADAVVQSITDRAVPPRVP
jgi:CubicO group peptidase (beta-lactamase class C family)